MKPGDTVMKHTGEHSPAMCKIISISVSTRSTAEIDIPEHGLYLTYLDYLKPMADHEVFEYDTDED